MADNWSLFDWQWVLPPNRPSSADVARVRALLATGAFGSVGILGSTPEYRDLCAQLEVPRVVLFERDKGFHRIATDLMAHTPRREQVVWGDWLSCLSEVSSPLDMLLSDFTSGNIIYEQRERFYDGVASVVAAGGIFYDRILRDTSWISMETLDERYENLPCQMQVANDFSAHYFFSSVLVQRYGVVDSTSFYRILEERFDGRSMLKRHLLNCRKITPPGGMWYYGRNLDDLSLIRVAGFELLSEYAEWPQSVFLGRAFSYLHKRR